MKEYKTMDELLKDIAGYENLYAVTEDGKVWSYRRKRFMKISNGNHGYQQVCLTDKNSNQRTLYIHQLVANAYLEPTKFNPDGTPMKTDPEINHKDANKSNNAVSNLEWCDRIYNLEQANKAKAVYCVELDKVFNSQIEAAKELNIYSTNISACCLGKQKTSGGYHWRYVE